MSIVRSSSIIVLAALATFVVGTRSARAVCTPWDGTNEDGGCLTSNKDASKCEQKVSGNAANLSNAIVKCHAKAITALVKKSKPFDEEACEDAAKTKFTATDTTDCTCVRACASGTNANSACTADSECPGSTCDTTTIGAFVEFVVDGGSGYVFCDPSGTPLNDSDEPQFSPQARVPSTTDILKCEIGLGTCTAKLVKAWTKCHQLAAKSFLKGDSFDEEACEEGPIPGKPGKAAVEIYNACTDKVIGKGGCAGCENPSQIVDITRSTIDGENGLIYCTE